MVAVALAFVAGAVLPAGGSFWSASLLLLLVLARPRFPFHRPAGVVLAVLGLWLAGLLHAANVPEAGTLTSRPAAPSATRTAEAAGRGGTQEARPVRVRLRHGALERIRAAYPSEAPMVEALILAERGQLDPEVRSAFVRTGAAHLLAISGFHVGVLAGWVLLVLRGVGLTRSRATAGAALVVWGYVALLGFPTSAVRAGLLLTGAAAGRVRGRPVHPLGAWGLALLAVALADPAVLARPGAQLSFAGALGLILWVDPWTRALRRMGTGTRGGGGVGAALAGALAASAAAQVATLPLAVWHFQRVAVLALPATLVATPLVSLALPGAFLGLVAWELGLPGAGMLTGGVESLLWAVRALMEAMAAWDPGWFLGRAPVTAATGAALLLWVLGRGRWGRGPRVVGVSAVVAGVVLAAPWGESVLRPRVLEIRVLDVGQGDAIAVGTPRGRWILVDTGAGSGERLARELVAGGIRRLDLLVLTHPDLDHMGAAAELIRTLPVAAVADGGTLRGTGAYRELVAAARARRIPWRFLRRGDGWTSDGVVFRVLHPGEGEGTREPNDRSVVLSVSWGEFDALLTGDVPVEVERRLLPSLRPVELLKVAHHGSRTSTDPAFLEAVRPALSVISVGRRNRFGHPAPEVLLRLQDGSGRVLRTDLLGDVVVRGREDGSYVVRTERDAGD